MASYVESSISARGDLSSLSTQTMRMIEQIDAKVVKLSSEVDQGVKTLRGKRSISKKKKKDLRAMHQVAEMLSERKAQVAVSNYDLINQHIIQIDHEIRTLEKAMSINGDEKLLAILGPVATKRKSRTPTGTGNGRRKTRVERKNDEEEDDDSPQDNVSVDPNEPVYCLCRQVAYGDMIACDNEECAIEWFHYSCVNLSKKPRSMWLCPDCSRRKRR